MYATANENLLFFAVYGVSPQGYHNVSQRCGRIRCCSALQLRTHSQAFPLLSFSGVDAGCR